MTSNASPTTAEILGETESFICTVAFYGPPVLFLAAPWLLLGLLLIGPFAALMTVVVALLAATALLAGIAAVLATPFLILRGRGAAAASRRY
jgi:hypothetical protein